MTPTTTNSDACHLCGKPELLEVRQVKQCDTCDMVTCGDCAEVDYDMVGEPTISRLLVKDPQASSRPHREANRRTAMKRSQIARKPDHVQLRRRRATLATIGKKGREWAHVRGELKRMLTTLGIDRCEFRFKDCTDRENLSLAHSMKRRFLGKGEERERLIREVGVACLNCHRELDERMTHEQMATAVRGVIARREVTA